MEGILQVLPWAPTVLSLNSYTPNIIFEVSVLQRAVLGQLVNTSTDLDITEKNLLLFSMFFYPRVMENAVESYVGTFASRDSTARRYVVHSGAWSFCFCVHLL